MSETPWVKSYPAGVHWDACLPVSTVPTLLHDAVARWSDQVALEFMGKQTSYRELQHIVDQATKGFQALGVKPGVHVGLFLPNTPHYVICFFAILQAGGTVVNYSPLDAEKVLAHKIEDSQTDLLVTLDMVMLYPQMAGMLSHTRLKKSLWVTSLRCRHIRRPSTLIYKKQGSSARSHWTRSINYLPV